MKSFIEFQKEEVELDEATVKTQKYSWGTMKTVHHGSDFSIPLHPEHHQEIAKLKDQQEHKFKDETGHHWTAKRSGDDVHFKGANGGNSTTVKHSTMSEEAELDEARGKVVASYIQKAKEAMKKKIDMKRKTAQLNDPNSAEKKIVKESDLDVEQIDEASRAKLTNYISAAKSDEKKDRSAGIALAQKKKWGDPKYGTVAAKVPANEEVEAIDEIKLADLPVRKIQGRAYGASTPEPHALDVMMGPTKRQLLGVQAEKKKKKFSEMVNLYQDKGLKSLSEMLAKEEVTEDEFNKEIEDAKEKNAGKKKNTEIAKGAVQAVKNEETEVVEYELDVDAINGVAIENIEERHMTEPETKKKEEIVKSMKKGLSGFKDRYGDRAKEVMYATATARAKGE